VKLHDQGLGAIEVTDDGHGVPKSSRPHMAARHATSKLRRFDDLYDDGGGGRGGGEDDCAPTLGFRGEALFCLANLSRSLVVCTRTADENDDGDDGEDGGGDGDAGADADAGAGGGGRRRRGGSSPQSSSPSTTALGEQFRFDRDGRLVPGSVARVPMSYRSGTTVTVRGLFESLPVRRADMRKRIKAQKMKLIKTMQGCELLFLFLFLFLFLSFDYGRRFFRLRFGHASYIYYCGCRERSLGRARVVSHPPPSPRDVFPLHTPRCIISIMPFLFRFSPIYCNGQKRCHPVPRNAIQPHGRPFRTRRRRRQCRGRRRQIEEGPQQGADRDEREQQNARVANGVDTRDEVPLRPRQDRNRPVPGRAIVVIEERRGGESMEAARADLPRPVVATRHRARFAVLQRQRPPGGPPERLEADGGRLAHVRPVRVVRRPAASGVRPVVHAPQQHVRRESIPRQEGGHVHGGGGDFGFDQGGFDGDLVGSGRRQVRGERGRESQQQECRGGG